MLQQYMKDLEQDPYDPEQFIEKLAWKILGNSKKEGVEIFDPVVMEETFVQCIKDFKVLQDRQRKKCEKLEQLCHEEEVKHVQKLSHIQEKNKLSMNMFQALDERINYIATKVIHLGNQLEAVNTPRSRAVEAQKLMTYFSEFLSPGPLLIDVFNDKDHIDEAADIIQKLYHISQEIPDEKFSEAKAKIAAKYDEIERCLIEEFVKAHRTSDLTRMQEIANILSHFKGYAQCVDAYIEQCQMSTFNGKDPFREVLPLCERSFKTIHAVFNNPDQVMAKFVLNIFHLKLQNHIVAILSDERDKKLYLTHLMDVYMKTQQVSHDLAQYNMGADDTYLTKLTQNIFQKYLDTYIQVETTSLKERCGYLLQKYYESKGHQKKQLQSGGLQDLRRDLQAVIGARANINIANIEDYGGETFLSVEVAIALLQETKMALERCHMLSRLEQEAAHAQMIFDVMLNYLIEHVDYGIELGIHTVPIPETKSSQPVIYFFNIVSQANTIIHLLEKHFVDVLVPLVVNSSKLGDCQHKKKQLLDDTELKIQAGLDRSLNAIVSWIKIYLQSEQRKSDFKPEGDIDTLASTACTNVCVYIASCIKQINACLDGANVSAVMTELGIRFHRVIYEHLLQFQYNSAGAMCVICDVNEYMKCAKHLKSLLVNTLFDSLHSLCNLLLVKPENLEQVCNGEQLAGLDRSILLNFIQLRSDYKTQKLVNSIKSLSS
ncbi:hypothetical protein M8J77_006268 [Diaphorina citri]|nr:hypothetical protein M8J77_006268 [Diaphorina citri]